MPFHLAYKLAYKVTPVLPGKSSCLNYLKRSEERWCHQYPYALDLLSRMAMILKQLVATVECVFTSNNTVL